jgi:hypothetical protein
MKENIIATAPLASRLLQVVLDLPLVQLPKHRLESLPRHRHQVFRLGHRHDPDLDRLLRHLALEPFLERQQSGVDSVFEGDVVVVSTSNQTRHTRETRTQ